MACTTCVEANLTEPEKALLKRAASGKCWKPNGAGPGIDPANAATWSDAHKIRAGVVRCLSTGCTCTGRPDHDPAGAKGLQILGARITDKLDLDDATLTKSLWLEGCSFEHPVSLIDAKTRTISFRGSHLPALNAQRAKIEGSLYLTDGFSAAGGVSLVRTTICGHLDCAGGKFSNAGATAYRDDPVNAGADAFLRNSEIPKPALDGDTIVVGMDVFLRDGFSATGKVNFIGAMIQGDMRCNNATYSNAAGTALDLSLAVIGAGLFFFDGRPKTEIVPFVLNGRLNLAQAKCRTYCDDPSGWPSDCKIKLDGFTYEWFYDGATDHKTRAKWLALQYEVKTKKYEFRPQPWTQAIKVLKAMGHDTDARELAIRREDAFAIDSRTIKKAGTKPRWRRFGISRFWSWFLGATIGYGYKPWYALYWSAAILLFSWLTFALAANLGYMAPRETGIVTYVANYPDAPLPKHYTEFNAFIYALDVYLPVIELRQDMTWEPGAVQQGSVRELAPDESWFDCTKRLLLGRNMIWQSVPAGNRRSCGFAADTGWLGSLAALPVFAFRHGFHRFVYWSEEIFGWIFVSLFIAGMSGIMKKE